MKKNKIFSIFAVTVFFSFSSHATELTEASLLGHWQCQSLMHGSMPDKTENFVSGWQKDDQGLAVTLDNAELDFTHTGGAYNIRSSSPNPFLYFSNDAVDSPFRVVGDQLVFNYYAGGTNFLWEIRTLEENKIRLVPLGNGYYPTVSCNKVLPLSAITTESTSTAPPSP